MIFQEQEQRGTEATLGETARAVMTGRATIREQLHGRFALIEILGMCRDAGERIKGAEHELTAPQLWLRHELQ
jgi:hypothetical protein